MGTSFLARLGNPGFDAITQDVALELSKYGEHAGECTAPGRGHIKRLGQRYEPDADGVELSQRPNQVEERAPPAIEAPDEDSIEFPPARRLQHFLSLRASLGAGADLLFLESHFPATALGVGAHRRELHRQGLLVVGRDTGIEPDLEHRRTEPLSGYGQKPLRNCHYKNPCFP